MPRSEIPAGPTGKRAASNVADLRGLRGMSKTELGRRMDALGRPMSIDVVTKLEDGRRRLDADDLAALALALDVTTNRLLLPDHLDGGDVELTPTVTVPVACAWLWATRLPCSGTMGERWVPVSTSPPPPSPPG